MFESRCGVCCDSCTKKEQVNCTGCPTMENHFGVENVRLKLAVKVRNLIIVVNVILSLVICF